MILKIIFFFVIYVGFMPFAFWIGVSLITLKEIDDFTLGEYVFGWPIFVPLGLTLLLCLKINSVIKKHFN